MTDHRLGFLIAAVLCLAPEFAAAQGIAASGEGAGMGKLGSNATGPGVANPLGLPETTAPVTGAPPHADAPAVEYARGYTDLNLGKFSEAAADFERALRGDPRNSKTLFMLGEALVGEGDLKGAVRAFEKALSLSPAQVVIRGEYGVALAKLGETDQATTQLGMLRLRSEACGGACAQAGDLATEQARIETALAAGRTP
jgi:tetratricopeptide (TPR) repeat protein